MVWLGMLLQLLDFIALIISKYIVCHNKATHLFLILTFHVMAYMNYEGGCPNYWRSNPAIDLERIPLKIWFLV